MGRKRLFDTFWDHFVTIEKTRCMEWTGGRFDNGYGMIYDPRTGTVRGVHVVAFELHRGLPPQKGTGLVVRHAVCDNPPCGNPAHLAGGTSKDNSRDAVLRGRHAYGERQGKAKLTSALVGAAKTLLAEGESSRAIARALGVDPCTILDLAAARTWACVAPGEVTPELRRRVLGAVARCTCGCGRALTKQCRYGYAWHCPNRPSQYELQASDPHTYRVCEDCGLRQPPFAKGLCRKCYLEQYTRPSRERSLT
jgi:ribosomal protein L40E